MLERLLNFWFRKHEIPQMLPDGTEQIYLRRWYIFDFLGRDGWPKRYNMPRVMLHHILGSDAGRDLHDHPWPFITIGLKGKYMETTPDGVQKFYKAPWVRYLRAAQLHRLDLLDGEVWTLVITGRKRRIWGFLTPEGWMPYWEYRATAKHVPRSTPVDL